MKAEPGRQSSGSPPADDALVGRIAEGDLTCLGVLFDRYEHDVRRLLARLGTPPSDLDDLVQQTFLDVPRASTRFRPGASVRAWLLGLATILARRRRRALSRMFSKLHEWSLEPRATHAPSAADTLELSLEAARARAALQLLSPKKREAFVLVVLEGMSCAQAAEIVGAPLPTVWSRIHHARAELRAILGEAP